jgi:2-C-methyl-D-erythritol 2,4-cyclodiphosphate synthase
MKTAIGQDSHRFDVDNREKPLRLGGVVFDDAPPLVGNSDADVVLHAITNAVSGITGVNILGKIADDLCAQGITDSAVYLKQALKHLRQTGQISYQINHLSISIECQRPTISPKITAMRKSIGQIMQLAAQNIGITATTGEGLTAFGRGEGIQVLAIITALPLAE